KGYENFDFAYNDENVAKFLQRSCFNGHSFRNFQGPDNSFFENSLMEKPGFKIGRYNPEERQERISKYRAKRNQRNFNKRIK
ncbi:hypothetical protein Golax_013330, partial [Gossypium laxum]|nr:hypothetical protein [Gossypium laxum]